MSTRCVLRQQLFYLFKKERRDEWYGLVKDWVSLRNGKDGNEFFSWLHTIRSLHNLRAGLRFALHLRRWLGEVSMIPLNRAFLGNCLRCYVNEKENL